MAQKIVEIAGLGPVLLAKRRGAKNLRLSIMPNGTIRVSLPVWAPYSSAISFAHSRREWLKQHVNDAAPAVLVHGQRIGKSYRINYVSKPQAKATQTRLGINSITISSPLQLSHHEVQNHARKAAERALRNEAEVLLAARLKLLASKYDFKYQGLKIKKLSSRWGSCSSKGEITLNYFLVQLPWQLIDYVLVHELAHTIHHNHGRDFWKLVTDVLPDAKERRKEIKAYRPIILAG